MPRTTSRQRGRILESAIRVFAEKGLDGTTIRMVGNRAGLNSALMYYYFEDKETLFQEAIRTVMAGFFDILASGLHGFGSARERLEYLVNSIFGYFTEHPERMRLMAGTITMHPERLGRIMNSFLRERTLTPIIVLREGMEQGQLRKMNPLDAWLSIMSLCIFSLCMCAVARHLDFKGLPVQPFDAVERRNHIIELLNQGLAASPGRRDAAGRSPSIRRKQ